mgnify:CR=1 FL=1
MLLKILHPAPRRLADLVPHGGRLGERIEEKQVLAGVEAMTKRPGEDYMAFVARCKANPIARQVKLADLADNMNLDRLPNPTLKDFERILKYRRARAFLLATE